MASWKAALIQMDSGNNEEENKKKAECYIRQAAEEGASLVIFPETVDYIGTGLKAHAKEIPGMWDSFFSDQARQYGMYIHGGSITEKNADGNPFNTSIMFGPDGSCIGKYRKLHLFDVEIQEGPSYRESDGICAGNEIVLVDTPLARFGLSICYDLRFPELFRIQSIRGAEVLIVTANFTRATGEKHWETLLRARAIENGCYVLACCQCGEKPAFPAYGNSMIIAPGGEVIVRGTETEGCVIGEIDPDEIKRIRRQIPSLENRRSDVYQLSSKQVKIF